MDPSDDLQRQLGGLSKGLVQANLRLSRVIELLEQQGEAGSSASDGAMDLLLDLLDAVEQTLRAASAPAPPRRWWQRPPAPSPDLSGLKLAAEQVIAQLGQAGVRRAPSEGPVDPLLHRVVDVLPTDDPALDGTLALTHRAGWFRPGPPPTVLRHAHVSARRRSEP